MNRPPCEDHHVFSHPSIDELADAAEDLVAADRGAEIGAHLEGCAPCREQAAALAAVTATLASEPAPQMPAQVAERLRAVVAEQPVIDPGQAPRPAVVSLADYRAGKPSLGRFGQGIQAPSRRRWLAPALVAAAAATSAGFGGYLLSASAGLNEPPTVAARINTQSLGPQAEALAQSDDLDPHRFSRAWKCARKVTDGRITGLAETSVNGRPALLVYLRSGGRDAVTVVTGCDSDSPAAEATAPLPR